MTFFYCNKCCEIIDEEDIDGVGCPTEGCECADLELYDIRDDYEDQEVL